MNTTLETGQAWESQVSALGFVQTDANSASVFKHGSNALCEIFNSGILIYFILMMYFYVNYYILLHLYWFAKHDVFIYIFQLVLLYTVSLIYTDDYNTKWSSTECK